LSKTLYGIAMAWSALITVVSGVFVIYHAVRNLVQGDYMICAWLAATGLSTASAIYIWLYSARKRDRENRENREKEG
jgi:divalent metal cation (Fe/Co/Zn/Cd) transporter